MLIFSIGKLGYLGCCRALEWGWYLDLNIQLLLIISFGYSEIGGPPRPTKNGVHMSAYGRSYHFLNLFIYLSFGITMICQDIESGNMCGDPTPHRWPHCGMVAVRSLLLNFMLFCRFYNGLNPIWCASWMPFFVWFHRLKFWLLFAYIEFFVSTSPFLDVGHVVASLLLSVETTSHHWFVRQHGGRHRQQPGPHLPGCDPRTGTQNDLQGGQFEERFKRNSNGI